MSDLNREMSVLSGTGGDQRHMAEYACSKSEEIQGQGPSEPNAWYFRIWYFKVISK